MASTGIIHGFGENGELSRGAALGLQEFFDGTAIPGTISDEVVTQISTTGTPANDAVRVVAAASASYYLQGLTDDDATDNRAVIQAALDVGGTVTLPPTTGRYAVTGSLVMTVPGTRLLCHGAPIRQTAAGPYPTVKVVAPDCEVDGLDLIGSLTPPNFSGMTAAYEGSIQASGWCGIAVYATAHRLRVPYVRVRNMSSAVRISGWVYATDTATTTFLDDVEIGLIVVDGVEFGLAAKATRRLKLGTAKGTYGNTATMPRPPHLVYFAPDSGGLNHSLIAVGDVQATGGLNGHASQFKNVVGGSVASVTADGCFGVVNIMDSADLEIGSLLSINDTYTDATGGSILMDAVTSNDRVRVRKAAISLSGNGRAVRILAATDVKIGTLDIIANHAATGGTTDYDVEVRGTRVTLGDVNVKNVGTAAWKCVGAFSGTGHRFTVGALENIRVGVDVRGTDTVVRYDRDRITMHATDGLSRLAGTGGAAQFLARQTDYLTNDPSMLAADNFTVLSDSARTLTVALNPVTWVQVAGSWRQDAETARASEVSSTTSAAAAVDVGTGNAAVSVDVVCSTGHAGIAVKVADAANYLACRFNTASATLVSRVSGVNTVVATVPTLTFNSTRRYHLDVKVYATEVKFYIDGVLAQTYTLTAPEVTAFGTSTKFGLHANANPGARFSSFQVRSL